MATSSKQQHIESAANDALAGTNVATHANALTALVHISSTEHDVLQGIHGRVTALERAQWLHKLVPGVAKYAVKNHLGNFVAIRGTDKTIFESMPLYVRIGMHLVFTGKEEHKFLNMEPVERLLEEQSVKQGKIYDTPESVRSIPSFMKTYAITTDEFLDPDLKSYKNFNEFFYRKLKEGARPVESPADPTHFCCPTDSRVTLYNSVDLARQFWIKGTNFTIPTLLNVPADSEVATAFDGGSLAIFRLAPQDYHRFHSPLDGVVGDVTHIPGQYYTVNPMAINEPGFDVFTKNVRSVLHLTHSSSTRPVAFVAVGAMLVGSIRWTGGGEKGKVVKRGEELGYFAYGGSTVIVVFAKDTIKFDADLVANSEKPIETLVKVGNSLGHFATPEVAPAKPAESGVPNVVVS